MSTAIRVKLAILIAVTALLSWILLTHVEWINGPWYWKWPPRHLRALRWYPPMLLAATPLFAVVTFASKIRPIVEIALVMLSMLAMQIVAATLPVSPPSFNEVTYTIESPTNFSYFTDAYR